jgi:hypothetical protein
MLVPKVNTKQTARQLTVPAPIGGLNGRDGLADMPRRMRSYLIIGYPVPPRVTRAGAMRSMSPQPAWAGRSKA